MVAKKKSKVAGITQTRCTRYAQKEIKALSERLFRKYETEHRALGINKPSSKVAVDALLYWSASAGMLDGKPITDNKNLFIAILGEAGEI